MIYNTLLQLPLFLGLNRRDFEEIVTHVKFDFQKRAPGSYIYRTNSINNHILFLISGEIEVTRLSNSSRICFIETLKAPSIVGADVLFGITHYFSHDYKSKSRIEYLQISKDQVTSHLLNYDIFRLNLLNYLSLMEQRQNRQLRETLPETLDKQFIQYLSHNFYYQAGEKKLKYKQASLALELGATKKKTCYMLHQMEDKGLLKLSRSYIRIPAFEKLVQ